MDMRLNEEQQMARDAFTRFFAQECPSSLIRALEEGDGHSSAVWGKLADMGAMALNLPEAYDGLDAEFTDTVLLYEAMGRSLYPSPHLWTAIVAAELILQVGSDAQKADLLPRIAEGDEIMTVALAERGSEDPAAVQMAAIHEGDSYCLRGNKRFVEYAPLADILLTVARTDAGVTLFLVPAGSEGLSLSRQDEISGGQFYAAVFGDVMVADDDLLGSVGGGLEPLNDALDRARVALAARMLGGCQAVFDLTLRYAKERSQFGQRLATFQNIAFRLAEMQTRIDGARLLLFKTAWLIDGGQPFATEAAMLKALMSDLYRQITGEAVQIHGGFGFAEEVYPQLYYRRAAVDAALLGGAMSLRDRVAEALELT